MPRVFTKTKNRGGKTGEYRCSGCADPIKPGDRYYEWSFRYGGTYRQHVSHGYPRQSQLTQSKMGEVYGAVEAVEDIIGSEGWELSEVQDALDNLVATADQIADEYRDASEPFGGQGEHADRADDVENFSSTVSDLSLDEFDPDDGESEDDWRDRVKGEVEAAIGEAP